MQLEGALCFVLLCLVVPCAARVRTHYIAAEEVLWNYAPTGINVFKGVPLEDDPESAPFFTESDTRIGGTYVKALYREYTDETFTEVKDLGADWEHLGNLGPPLYAEVGDTLEIHFKNMARFDFSMHASGLSYDDDNEGVSFPGSDNGGVVPPGGTAVYRWYVPGRAGPAPGDWSSVLYPYTSQANPFDFVAGLVGPIIVTAKGMADDEGRPKDVDREFVLFYLTVEESDSPYLNETAIQFLGSPPSAELLSSRQFRSSNRMHAINGMMFNNLPGLTMTSYERVRWYVFGLGNDFGIHSAHWHGQTFLDRGLHRADVTAVYPGIVSVVDMIPDSPGIWFHHCHVNSHVSTGMMALFEVLPLSDGYTTARNLATTSDLFSFLFPTTVGYSPRVDVKTTRTVSNPFSSAVRPSVSIIALLSLCLALLCGA